MTDKNIEIFYDEILIDKDHLKAVKYKIGDEKIWIPKSQIRAEDLVKQTITLPFWLIKAKGLESYGDD